MFAKYDFIFCKAFLHFFKQRGSKLIYKHLYALHYQEEHHIISRKVAHPIKSDYYYYFFLPKLFDIFVLLAFKTYKLILKEVCYILDLIRSTSLDTDTVRKSNLD